MQSRNVHRISQPLLLSVGLGMVCALQTLQAAPPDAAEILRQARVNHISGDTTLDAQLRSKQGNVPFRILLHGEEIRYEFENPKESIVLRLGENRSELLKNTGGKDVPVQANEAAETVRSSGINLEDLALRFLYWPEARYLGDDVLRTRPAHQLELHPKNRESHYGAVRIWVDQSTSALLRIEGYDWKGNLSKRFEVISAQRIDGQWFLKSMRVETFDPETKKITDRTYLDVLPPST